MDGHNETNLGREWSSSTANDPWVVYDINVQGQGQINAKGINVQGLMKLNEKS